MDTVCCFDGSLGARNGYFLYDGGVHPSLIGCGLGRDGDTDYSGT